MPTPSSAIATRTASDLRRGRLASARLASLLALAATCSAWAQAPTKFKGAPIYTCDLNGRKITSDRYIQECSHREQRVLNSDGSLNHVVTPTLTPEQLAAEEARQREAEAKRVAEMDAFRRDRNLMQRFPNEAAHAKAREKALDDIRNSVRNSEARVAQLQAERKPLLDETEFYVGKPMPGKLKLALDSNDASLEAQRSLVQNQQTEVVRINALFDAELARLKKLWSGTKAGSLGPLPVDPAGTTASKGAAPKAATALRVPETTRVKSP
jgi:hypothetical protein